MRVDVVLVVGAEPEAGKGHSGQPVRFDPPSLSPPNQDGKAKLAWAIEESLPYQRDSALTLRQRGAGTSRSFFAVIPGWSVGQSRTKAVPRLGPSGASTSPESGFAVSD